MAREFDDIKDGTLLEPYHLNIIYRELRRLRKMTASEPLALDCMTSTTSPPLLSGSFGIDQGRLAKTSTGITARSGTTAGTGSVIYQDFDGADFAADTDEGEVDVFNFSGKAIATGLYCVVTEFGDYLFVTSLECPP